MLSFFNQGQAKIGVLFIALFCLTKSLYSYDSSPQVNDTSTSTSVAVQSLQLPLYFELNEGQTEASVQYLTRGKGYTFYFKPQEIVMVLQKKLEDTDQFSFSVLKMQFVGAKADPFVQGLEEQASKSHYYIGNDPTNWHTNISNYAKVSYQDLYPGIDAVFYGNSQQLEYDILVAPHHNPQQAVLHIEGAKELSIDQSGNLHMLTADYEDIYMQKPFVYQITNGEKITIEGQFVLLAQNDVGFAIGAYDTNKLLVIDPVLSYSTYLGGSSSGFTSGTSIAVDNTGSVYVTGSTGSANFPTTTGAFQTTNGSQFTNVFVTKLDSSGSSLAYSTYLGGSGSGRDAGNSIAVDSTGSAYITGSTTSTNFPGAPSMFGSRKAFVAKLSSDGSMLVYSTLLGGGGTSIQAFDSGNGIAIDSAGNAYIAGYTGNPNFLTTIGAFQTVYGGGGSSGFVSKLNASGSIDYSTFLGGSVGDSGNSIAVDSTGNTYITGLTSSPNFPTLNPFQGMPGGGISNAFVTKLNPAGSALVYSTFLGGSNADIGNGIAIDSTGSAYITGSTSSIDFPTVNPFQASLAGFVSNAFVTKLDPNGSTLIYSTYLGGSGTDSGNSIAVDSKTQAYVTGSTTSTNFPTKDPIQSTNAGGSNVFVTKLNLDGSNLIYSTYLGGSGTDSGNGIAVDTIIVDNVHIHGAYVTGSTTSTNFPTANAIYPANTSSASDAFIFKIVENPKVMGVSPNVAPETGGNLVTIMGENFTGAVAVSFGGTPAMFTVNSDTQITAMAPPGKGTVHIRVATIRGISDETSADQFTYIGTIIPPEHARGKQIKNQFATQTDIANVITWHAPSSGQAPAVYKIFRNANLTELIDVVPANQDRLEFIDHNRQENHTYNYFIVSVDAAGNQSIAVHVKVKTK